MLPDTLTPAYLTNWGAAHCGDSLDLLAALPDSSVNLVLTSPPFALQREKEYGNKAQAEYVAWLAQFARLLPRKLQDDGFLEIITVAATHGRPKATTTAQTQTTARQSGWIRM